VSKNLRDEFKELKEIIDELWLIVKYLKFDLEATRREREYYKKLMGKK